MERSSPPCNEHGVIRPFHHRPIREDLLNRVLRRLTGLIVHDAQNIIYGFAFAFVLRPSGKSLSHRVHLLHQSSCVSGYHRVTDRIKDSPIPLLNQPSLLLRPVEVLYIEA